MSVGLGGSGPKIRSSRVHHEIAAMSIQPYSKASNENANPDNPIIRIMRRSSEMEQNETDIITDRNKKMHMRIVVLSNVDVPSTVSRLTLRDRCRQRRSSRKEHGGMEY
jgi:hypothetical protein